MLSAMAPSPSRSVRPPPEDGVLKVWAWSRRRQGGLRWLLLFFSVHVAHWALHVGAVFYLMSG